MLQKTITYKDYEGNERKETFFFNLTKAEVMEMQMSENGGYHKFIQRIIDAQDQKTLVALFRELLLKAYGEKSADGRRFIKSKELSEAFSQTEAYSDLYMELCTNTTSASEFVNGIIPAGLKEYVEQLPSK